MGPFWFSGWPYLLCGCVVARVHVHVSVCARVCVRVHVHVCMCGMSSRMFAYEFPCVHTLFRCVSVRASINQSIYFGKVQVHFVTCNFIVYNSHLTINIQSTRIPIITRSYTPLFNFISQLYNTK